MYNVTVYTCTCRFNVSTGKMFVPRICQQLHRLQAEFSVRYSFYCQNEISVINEKISKSKKVDTLYDWLEFSDSICN